MVGKGHDRHVNGSSPAWYDHPPCYWVSPVGACVLGAVAGVLVIGAMGARGHSASTTPWVLGPFTACAVAQVRFRSASSPAANTRRLVRVLSSALDHSHPPEASPACFTVAA
jgi:hypothetical protein